MMLLMVAVLYNRLQFPLPLLILENLLLVVAVLYDRLQFQLPLLVLEIILFMDVKTL